MYSVSSFFTGKSFSAFQAGAYRGSTGRGSEAGVLLAAALGLQNFRHFVSGGIGSVPLEVAGNGEDGVAHADFGHAVRAADGGLLAGDVGHIGSFH